MQGDLHLEEVDPEHLDPLLLHRLGQLQAWVGQHPHPNSPVTMAILELHDNSH